MHVQPFEIRVEQPVLDDLRARLAGTRWPDEPGDAGWGSGTSLAYLRGLCEYWREGYDWRRHETALNTLPQFKARVDELDLHFVHAKAARKGATPLLLLHGWPDSFYRFHKVVPMLLESQPEAFDVVVPSLPGFGFSERRGMGCGAMADHLVKLMHGLGYPRFAVAGGDVGALVARHLASRYADSVTAVHVTDVGYPMGMEDPSTLSEAEREFAGFVQGWFMREGAYAMLHSTRPASIAPGLTDSPAGLAAWLISMIDSGADQHDVEGAFGGRDELLTNIMIYWVTRTISSSIRNYAAEAQAMFGGGGVASATLARSRVPAALTVFQREAPTPREWAERAFAIRRYTRVPRGGHFAALEIPDDYVRELRESFAELQSR
jgi:pimeloyl-ACP methyl ester carboxylesterase